MAKAAKKPPTKTEILAAIAEATQLTKKQVAAVFEALANELKKNLGARGPGVFALPGLLKIERKRVAARPARKAVQVRNPATGAVDIRDLPAKPAFNKVRVRALKPLKEMVK